MNLGPLTRQALLDAGIHEQHIEKIEEGCRWEISPAPIVGISGDFQVAKQAADDAARRRSFVFKLWSSDERGALGDTLVIEQAVEGGAAARIDQCRRQEQAAVGRDAKS